ncbi:MAG: hypothetical protein NVSMB2_23860 [Chloroflexota bacterium]
MTIPAVGHVLVVEDDVILRETLQWALEDEGLQVMLAVDGLDALERAAIATPDLVVLDMGLPGLDGYGVAAGLRAQHGEHISILVVTADGGAREKARRVGAYAYLHKPFDIDKFVERVKEGIAQR